MTLAHIFVSVLSKLRRISFEYMWVGNKSKKCYHLCNWQFIAKPKQLGGWGLRNICIFYRALATNTFWWAFMKTGIWKRVIHGKYLPQVPVSTWLRSAVNFTSFGSQTWKNILNTLPIILDRIAWTPDSRKTIIIGRDCICGLNDASLLLEDQIWEINRKQIYFLFQASRPSQNDMLGQNWATSYELDLDGNLGQEWDIYRNLLLHANIVLKDHPDELKWIGDDSFGHISVKNVYNTLSNKF
jgi:hypothetical protein